MKKYWALLAFAVAILCLALNSELWTSRYYWHIPAMPTVLTWVAVILGIPSGLLLFFYICRFLIVSVIHPTYKVTFLSILWLGIIVIVLMCLYPPWAQIYRLPSSNIKGTYPLGCAFIWDPPDTNYAYSIAIDYTRLLLQILPVVLITGGLLFTLRICQSKGRLSEP